MISDPADGKEIKRPNAVSISIRIESIDLFSNIPEYL